VCDQVLTLFEIAASSLMKICRAACSCLLQAINAQLDVPNGNTQCALGAARHGWHAGALPCCCSFPCATGATCAISLAASPISTLDTIAASIIHRHVHGRGTSKQQYR